MSVTIENAVRYPNDNPRESLRNVLAYSGLDINGKTLYSYLLSHVEGEEELHPLPSYSDMAEDLLLEEAELLRCVKSLQENYFITIKQREVEGATCNVHSLSEFLL